MDKKLKELEQRRLRIGKAINEPSVQIRKLENFVKNLAGSCLVEPFGLPGSTSSHKEPDELVVRTLKNEKNKPKGTFIYVRTRKPDGELYEIRLQEAPLDLRCRIVPYLEQYAEYLVSQLEQKFDIDTDHDYYQQSPIGSNPKLCHIGHADHHCCDDASDCRYAQPDGPDDYINECDCYFEGQE